MENKTLDNLRPLTDEELQSANGGAPPGPLPPTSGACSDYYNKERCNASGKCSWDEDNYHCRPL